LKSCCVQDLYDDERNKTVFHKLTQHQTCKTKIKTKTDFLVSDRSCPKTDGLRPHYRFLHSSHWSFYGLKKTIYCIQLRTPAIIQLVKLN